MSEHRPEVMRRMLDAFNRDDVDAVIASFAEHCQIIEQFEMPDAPVHGFRGHRGIREWMANLRGTAGAEFELRTVTEAGDYWLCELASRGLSPASGVRVEWTTFVVVRIRDDKIEHVRVFLDRGSRRAAGVGDRRQESRATHARQCRYAR
jgi:ketosteroid isomerase-like protein